MVIVVGNSGTGKSSNINAWLGKHPSIGPAKTGAGCMSVTIENQRFQGYWFGNEAEPEVVFIDTPGLSRLLLQPILSLVTACDAK